MTPWASDFATIRTSDDQGNDLPRYTQFTAVIPLAELRQVNFPTPTVRVTAVDFDGPALGLTEADGISYLAEADITGADIDQNPTEYLPTAVTMLADWGFQPAGDLWAHTTDHLTIALTVR